MVGFVRFALFGCALTVGLATIDVAAARASLYGNDVADDGVQLMMLARFAADEPPSGAIRVPAEQLPRAYKLVSAWRYNGHLYLVTSRPIDDEEVRPKPDYSYSDDRTRLTATTFAPSVYFVSDRFLLSADAPDAGKQQGG